MGDLGSIQGLGRSPGEGKGYPLQYSGLENAVDYSPWGHKESDTTERLIICKDSIEHLLLFSHFKEKETQVHWPKVTQLI